MRVFKNLYEIALRWAAHPHAERFLAPLSFVEAFIFPVAPEVMLAPMTLAKPQHWVRYASISLAFSMFGGLVGYAIGYYAITWVEPILHNFGYWETFLEIKKLAFEHGFWMLLIAGFTPVPLKIFTLASGAIGMPLPAFIGGMLIGRGKRVFILTGLICWGGEKAEAWLHRSVEWLGWLVVAAIIGLIMYFEFFR